MLSENYDNDNEKCYSVAFADLLNDYILIIPKKTYLCSRNR